MALTKKDFLLGVEVDQACCARIYKKGANVRNGCEVIDSGCPHITTSGTECTPRSNES